ncbi:Aminodeoxyfutalosine deaminase [Mycobacterium pseudokansasii]|uniref:adenosine deaminase n=3 Tax=Mycobacterium pseudokansasii TaxID=2341080 RepID=A0A498QY18_9MYCO|nr:Aminodeoxyfutalosine deaminase [Mycobacterium pseudokansasii]VBA31659.1 Aminodeoxyfutalosine deaminase [Mycobacterium pseudokansasii]VBA54202.1 Aminodeoxyfutalosine deaminase [Mycobacterium pseudokansasii]
MAKQRRLAIAVAWMVVLGVLLAACREPVSWAMGTPKRDSQLSEARTAAFFDTIRDDPAALAAFLHAMPKGGDLHNHPSGAEYAERFISYAAGDGLCVDLALMTLVAPTPPCDAGAGRPAAASALADPSLYNALVDAWSMRDWDPQRPGRGQFFATFRRFGLAWDRHYEDVLADIISQAAAENVYYLELMYGDDQGRASGVGARIGWDDNLERLHGRLLAARIADAVAIARRDLDTVEAHVRSRLRCGTPVADRGCAVMVRYLRTVNRALPPEQIFAQLVAGYQLVQTDPRVVGINLAGIEDGYVARRDYRLQMAMLDYLHGVAPDVPIALHAGELAPGLVPPEDLRFHIREAVERGHARRIGHGVDVMSEDDPSGLLAEMAKRKVLVEILFKSNAEILGVTGDQHPFMTYRAADVPVALATDDEGVSRSDMTAQFHHAVNAYHLRYTDLKQLARQSLEYAFLPGNSLWARLSTAEPVAACTGDRLGGDSLSRSCSNYLESNERAREQWRLESAYIRFESGYLQHTQRT